MMKLIQTTLTVLGLAGLSLLGAACGGHDHHDGDGHDHGDKKEDAAPATGDAKGAGAYPLTVCVVSGEKLGGMGEPYTVTVEGRTVKLCCDGCEEDLLKEPAKYLAKLDAALKAGK